MGDQRAGKLETVLGEDKKRPLALTVLFVAGVVVLAIPFFWKPPDDLLTIFALSGVALTATPLFRSGNAIFDWIRGYKDLQLSKRQRLASTEKRNAKNGNEPSQ